MKFFYFHIFTFVNGLMAIVDTLSCSLVAPNNRSFLGFKKKFIRLVLKVCISICAAQTFVCEE
jgi:hypothetical protein